MRLLHKDFVRHRRAVVAALEELARVDWTAIICGNDCTFNPDLGQFPHLVVAWFMASIGCVNNGYFNIYCNGRRTNKKKLN